MLRLTRAGRGASGPILRVEGRIVSEWVALLERECTALLRESGAVQLDLSGVTYVDRRGVEVLNGYPPTQLTIVGCPPLFRDLLSGCDSG